MKIAVEGCCHGELDKIYETIAFIEKKDGIKVCIHHNNHHLLNNGNQYSLFILVVLEILITFKLMYCEHYTVEILLRLA